MYIYDINTEISNEIERYCNENNILLVGRISFNPIVTKAIINGKSIMEYPEEKVCNEIKAVWERRRELL
ncbi:MAG: hypothetical protein AB1485_02335 [Candidatus Thermoplasmatota archaeon]